MENYTRLSLEGKKQINCNFCSRFYYELVQVERVVKDK